jgi:hypothetical protein
MPNVTDTFVFPLEVPEFYTRMSLRKYERPKPGSNLTPSFRTYIRLPIPQQLADSFNISVSGNNMELLGNISNAPAQLAAAGRSLSEDFAAAKGGEGSAIMKMVGEVAALTPGISDSNLGKFSQSNLGIVRNPHLTSIFEGVALKQYQFTWRISPKSEKEAQSMNKMLEYIKAFMHPEIIGEGFALDYPYLATVEFVTGSNNINLPNVSDSFITGLNINSIGGGAPAFYRDGTPVITEITMTFQEIDIKTRSDFGGGKYNSNRVIDSEGGLPPVRNVGRGDH